MHTKLNRQGGHEEGPEWGRVKSVTILVIVTVLFSLVAEQLVDALDSSIEVLGLNQAFVGVLFLGVVSNTVSSSW